MARKYPIGIQSLHQQQHIICSSPGGMSGQTLNTYCGSSNTATDEDDDAIW
ncbi:MAG: hypothetical protein IJT53_01740 [Prevotella sp.]|nr:hypothetical protein [Prevotella sp.]